MHTSLGLWRDRPTHNGKSHSSTSIHENAVLYAIVCEAVFSFCVKMYLKSVMLAMDVHLYLCSINAT